MNPLRSGIIENINSYQWSNYLHYVGKKSKPAWLFTEDILSDFSHKGDRYAQFVMDWYKQNDDNSSIDFYGKNSILGIKSYFRDVIEGKRKRVGEG